MKPAESNRKRPSAKKAEKEIAAVDRFLARGGFRRAANPKGSLVRARKNRDLKKKPKAVTRNRVEIFRTPKWERQKHLVHGFSTRTGGHSTVFGGHDLNLGFVKHDVKSAVEKNRKLFFRKVAAATDFELVTLKQVHSNTIHEIARAPKRLLVGDGVITNKSGLLLSVQTADCVPVLLFDQKKGAIGAFHAGWRGTAQRVVESGIGRMRMAFGSKPRDIHAAIGPCIQQCCYAVGQEVVDEFHSQFTYAADLFRDIFDDDPVKQRYPLLFLSARPPGHGPVGKQPHLDLTAANRRQLLDAGVEAENIWVSDLCTGCNTDRLFSHRKEDGFTGRMMAVIGMRDD